MSSNKKGVKKTTIPSYFDNNDSFATARGKNSYASVQPVPTDRSVTGVENYALLPSYCGRKYIDNYSNTASGVPAYLGLFV